MEENVPFFPPYDPPNPDGIPVAHPKFHKPLYKMMKMLIQKPKTAIKPRTKTKRLKKRTKFY